MLGKIARGTVLVILATLIVAYIFAGKEREPRPPAPSDQIIGYYNA